MAKRIISVFAVTVCVLFMAVLPVRADSVAVDDIPLEYVAYCDEIGERYGVCSEILQSLIYYESRGDVTAQNGDCIGLMQVREGKLANEMLGQIGKTDLWDAKTNIEVGCMILLSKKQACDGDIAIALGLYNGRSDAYTNPLNSFSEMVLTRSQKLEEIRYGENY